MKSYAIYVLKCDFPIWINNLFNGLFVFVLYIYNSTQYLIVTRHATPHVCVYIPSTETRYEILLSRSKLLFIRINKKHNSTFKAARRKLWTNRYVYSWYTKVHRSCKKSSHRMRRKMTATINDRKEILPSAYYQLRRLIWLFMIRLIKNYLSAVEILR